MCAHCQDSNRAWEATERLSRVCPVSVPGSCENLLNSGAEGGARPAGMGRRRNNNHARQCWAPGQAHAVHGGVTAAGPTGGCLCVQGRDSQAFTFEKSFHDVSFGVFFFSLFSFGIIHQIPLLCQRCKTYGVGKWPFVCHEWREAVLCHAGVQQATPMCPAVAGTAVWCCCVSPGGSRSPSWASRRVSGPVLVL